MRTRNAIQHFCAPDDEDLSGTALEFIFKNIDPLIQSAFNLFAIEHHEDDIGYDYVVSCLIQRELEFSIPDDFEIGEVDLNALLSEASPRYRKKFKQALRSKGISM